MKKKLIWGSLSVVLIVQAIAFMHAYRFTHFSESGQRTRPEDLTVVDKASMLFTGIENPRPVNARTPLTPFEILAVESDVRLEAWLINVVNAKGTIIMFHGYCGEKSSLLTRSEQFNSLGYNTLLVDFMGSGGSSGNSTTIGYYESREVTDCFNFLQERGEKNIHLFGTSMGAAAILKAVSESSIKPSSILLECPFGRLDETVAARFRMMGIPSFPMSDILTFWGGVQQGYWAFDHNPEDYAKQVQCPTLLMFGEKDDRVSKAETDRIFSNLSGKKTLVTYPEEGHAVFTAANQLAWLRDVSSFLLSLPDIDHPSGSE